MLNNGHDAGQVSRHRRHPSDQQTFARLLSSDSACPFRVSGAGQRIRRLHRCAQTERVSLNTHNRSQPMWHPCRDPGSDTRYARDL
jgi:hypothetical protein